MRRIRTKKHDFARGSVSVFLLLALFLLIGGSYLWSLSRTSCERTLSYALGSFDDRFGITREEFLSAIQEAEGVWERDTGFDLFMHDASAAFQINLVFDERQEEALALQTLEENLTVSGSNIAALEEEYRALSNQYQERFSAYEAEVAQWNSQGGAPSSVFRELQAERRSLESLRLRVNSLARSINNYVAGHNTTVEAYNSRVGGAFTQGDYTGNAITIYQFDDRTELVLVLVHELGHALGLDHVESDTEAVMYHLMRDQDINSIGLTSADIAALRAVCGEQ